MIGIWTITLTITLGFAKITKIEPFFFCLPIIDNSSFAHPYGMQKVDVVCFTDS